MTGFNMKVTPEIEQLTEMCKDHSNWRNLSSFLRISVLFRETLSVM